MNQKKLTILELISREKWPLLILLVFFLIATYGLTIIQSKYYCPSGSCPFWGGMNGFLILNFTLGWVVGLYIWSFFKKISLSKLMTVLAPIGILLYLLCNYYIFGLYTTIMDDTLIQATPFEKPTEIPLNDIQRIDTEYQESADTFWTVCTATLHNNQTLPIRCEPVNYLEEVVGIPVFDR